MVTENGTQGDGNTSFLRAARAGNLDKVLEHLKNNIDINTSNANGLNALHLASKDGHIHVVSELLRRGAIVDSATKKGNTALHIASLAGQEEVVKLLLQHGASVNVQSQNGFTPLYMAAQENHDSVVKLLLSNGANQSLATEDGFTPLAVAMQQGHDKVVAVLLESDTRGKVRLPALHIAAKKDDVKAATLLLDNDHNPDVTSKSGFTPLHIASHYGNQAIANLLIQKGADVNFSAKHNISPLHVAAKWGKTNMVSLLLEKGANIEAKTRDGLTPLHCAARSGHEQVVDMLLERGAPISAKTKNGLAPLHMAAQGEHVDAARILLYHRAPVDEVTVDYLTALHVAAHCGHVRVAKLLLDRNADANARALNGFTPLHIACKKNRIKVVELLLRHGASISATTESGLTPLHVAAFMGCMNIVIYLLQHDASPDVPTVRGETPLHLAARANQTDIIRILLRNGAQVDARAREQQTPLHIASRLGNVDIVMLLLQHGAQVDATTKDMYTALHIAAKEGQDEVAGVLIENGSALDAATKKGFTPLHLTAKYGHIKVAQLLLQKEADVDAQGKNGVTPLHVACHYDNQNVALLLLEKGASPHATAKNGHTPLHIAARKNQMDIAATLLEYGAQANAESKAGFTPLHLSCQEGHSEISNLLIEHKAGVNQPAKNGLTPMHLCAQEDNVNVAEILQRNGANIDMATKAGYTPLHVAAHFGQANMVRFLLQHGANVNAATSIGYTPLHQSAQQGHCHIVKLLLEHNANANAQTTNGQTPLDIARKLGYISVLDSLKSITDEQEGATQLHSDEKYRVVAPEAMHESFMSDSEEEGGDTNDWDLCLNLKSDSHKSDSHVYLPYYRGEDNMLSDQPYRYLTVDEMKSLGDDSLPIDVTRDERVDSNRMAQSAEYAGSLQQQPIAEDAISPHKTKTYNTVAGKSLVDGIYMANGINDEVHPHVGRKLQWKSFLVSFLVDARGGAMRGCRHSGVRMIIPSRSTCQPTRVTCRYVKPQRTMHPPQLMEGEALASRVLELGPVSSKFIGPIIMEVPHFASLRGKEREIIILRSDNGETWREHTIDNSEEIIHDVLQQCFEPEEIAQLEEQAGNHVCRFVTYDFPQYFAVVTRIRQEVHAIGPEGGMVSSTVVPQVQAVFPQGALTKKIKVGLQAQPVDPDLTAKLLGRGVAVSPIVTVEPRRRKFHKAITLSMPAPKAHSQGMINQYSGNTPTLRLLCSITGGPSRAQWEDVTGSTPLTFVNDCVSFTTTVSARFWLMDCRNISDATKMATELYKEVIHVPFIAKFVVFAKKIEPFEARLRVFCMTDDREDKTLEKMELYTQVAKSRDVEVLEGKLQYIEMAGNLVPVTKSGEQLQLPFKAFRENRLPFSVRVKDQHADIVGRTLFMKEPKVAKGEPPQHPICILNIVLPEAVIPDSLTAFSDKITPTYRSSLLSFSKHQNDHYIGDIRIVDLSNLLGKDWIQLASEIDIGVEEIDEIINQNSDSIARQAQSMIRLYKDKPNYDIHSLELALKMIGRDDIMNKCKSGRLSHSRDFDETDIMKNSESVEELVQQESKRIQQIHEREEVKYSAEEKEIEESESDEEIAKRTVAERRDKIVKRLSIERQIPASSQKKEITREITEIKRKSLIEDKKAIHESEIFMQLPADNSVKSSVIPDQVIKMKMGKMDSTEVSKSQFDKELTHKFKSSSRSSEEEPEEEDISSVRHQVVHEEMENLKIVKDITSVEKPSKIIESLISEKPSMSSGSKQLTEDFLAFEKLTQLPSQTPTLINIDTKTEKLIEVAKDKSSDQTDNQIKETAQEFVTETVKTASKKVESIICTFESSNQEKHPQSKEILKDIVQGSLGSEKETLLDSTDGFSEGKTSIVEKSIDETKESTVSETASVKDKIKAFSEPKYEDISEKSRMSKTDDKIKNEAKLLLNAEEIKSEKPFKTVESFMESTSTKIPKVVDIVQSTKDFISSESEKTENKIKEKSSKIKSEEALTTDVKSVEFKELISNAEAFPSAPIESKTVADTIRVSTEDDVKETIKAESDIKIVKSTILKESKTVYNKKSEEFEEQETDTKKVDVLETKSIAEAIKFYSEPKIENIKTEITNFDANTDLVKDSLVQDAKSIFDVKTNEIKGIIFQEKEPLTADIKTESMKKKISSSEEETDIIRMNIENEEHISDSKISIHAETKTSVEKVKSMSEMKDSLNKERTKILKEDLENDSKNMRNISTEDNDFIITEVKTVAETIKSFTEPKATASKIDKKQGAEIPTRVESKKLSEAIKSLSESFEKPIVSDHKPEKKEIIPSTNIENKIADFETKKVTYEYHGLEPKPRLSLATKLETDEKEIIGIDVISTHEAAPGTQSAVRNEEDMLGESLEKLEEMKSIVADARKITKDFLSKEQQMQIPTPINKQTKEETRLVEERVKTTITFPPVVETSPIADKMVMKEEPHLTSNKQEKELKTVSTVDLKNDTIQQSVQDHMLGSIKLTHEFLTVEQTSQLLYEKQSADDISELSTETSQHSLEKSPILEQDSEKTSLEEFEKPVTDTKKITHEFLSMEQKHQPCITLKQEKKDETKRTSIIDEVLIQASDIITSISAGTEVPKESLTKVTVKKREIDELKDDGIDIMPIQESQEIETSAVRTLTQDFLSFEGAQPSYSVSKTSSEHIKTTSEQSPRQFELEPIEQRKSLTDAEFCKSVKESITKKMSEGLIDISDELKMQEIDIPHSQTPPPTPIEIKSEMQNDEDVPQKLSMEEDNLKDTIKTLHKTTESSFERVSTISTIGESKIYFHKNHKILLIFCLF
ncbi:hypothetical protein DOY81_007312 [Sarcophaga bullata]|nr:hypothetical protein DOY81_007312 [Sarcophaga bullata]